jgi:hypothetical protein
MNKVVSKCGKWAIYGDSDSSILVCGNSHAVAMMNGLLLPEMKDNSQSNVQVCYYSHWTSGTPRGEDYWSFVAECSRDKHVAVAWNGNQHNEHFMFQTEPKFTILGVSEDISLKDTIPVSLSMVKEFFKTSFDGLAEVVAQMNHAKSVTLLSGPAPKPLSQLKTSILNEKYFADIVSSTTIDTSEINITSDSLRFVLWSVLAGMLEEYSHELGVNFLSAPARSIDKDGMLLSGYWESDATHANSKYGLLLFEELNRLFREK